MANANGRRTNPNIEHGSAAPLTGTYEAGDIVINYNPTSTTGDIGWVCVAAGSPGTWITFGSVTNAAQTIAGAKTFSAGVSAATLDAATDLRVATDKFTVNNLGAVTAASSIRGLRNVTKQATAATVNLTAANSGTVYVNTATSGTTVFALPTAAVGLTYSFVEGGDAGGMVKVTASSGDIIIGKTDGGASGTGLATLAAGSIENTGSGNVRGDFCTLVAIDTDIWHMVAVAGVWAVSA